MNRLRAVVFDMDGLMFNTEEIYYQVGTELMRRRGRQFTRQLCDAIMGRPPRDSFQTMIQWHGLDERWEAMAAESEEIFVGLLDGWLAPMPGLAELLDALETAGLPKAICTSSSRRLLMEIVCRFRMETRFQFMLAAEDITHGKPHPEIYLKAAEQFGIEPPQMLVLEDSQAGCRAGAAAGAVVIAVPGPHSRTHDFSAANLVVQGLRDPRLYEAIGLELPLAVRTAPPAEPDVPPPAPG
ncbi:MAG: HAD family hydrolase [Thermoguttaceae bacterium]